MRRSCQSNATETPHPPAGRVKVQDSDGDSRTGYGGRGLPIHCTQPHRASPYPLMRAASSVVGPSQNPASGAAHNAAGHRHPSFPHNTGCLARHAVTPPARRAPSPPLHHHLPLPLLPTPLL
ncbi:hypothetical protein Hamer_G024388 [Homarus americanus]|uniref:Uncharacterized protein n=1 Tax=Homarus americanus TaxID=6706 RepID=A0A8J5N6U8_HOMAM|nr:hypothetical protein Hamer_G024388 [Homarus americanus]